MRSGRALNLALIFVWALTVGCDSAWQSPLSPLAAANGSPAPPAPEAPSPSTAASLALEHGFAIEGPPYICSGRGPCEPGPGYVYEVRFLARELGGRSGATIKEILVYNPNPGAETFSQAAGESCWIQELRVPPGETLDTFYTEAGSEWLSYCYVGIGSSTRVSSIPVEVFFKDDYGARGSVRTTISTFHVR